MRFVSVLAAIAALWVQPAMAVTLLDNFPTGPLYEDDFTNQASTQNFLVQFYVPEALSINRVDILGGGTGFAWNVNALALIKLRADVNNRPADTNLFSFQRTVGNLSQYDADTKLVSVFFPDLQLQQGTYWIGLSGDGLPRTWASYSNPGGAMQYSLSGDSVGVPFGLGTLAIRVFDTRTSVSAVPEPSTWAMMLIGFGAVGASMRRKSNRRFPSPSPAPWLC
jgi:hypothetical protein